MPRSFEGTCSCGQRRNFQYRCPRCGQLGINPRDYKEWLSR
jgi:uncharacterized C2H2 Zn-finger protein